MLLEHGEIEWQGNLRKTFDKYLHPNNIDVTDPKLYEMLGSGEVLDLFQFSTEIGLQAAVKIQPTNLIEVAAANSLMRLMSGDEEQPIDTFIKYKNDISLWYKEMEAHGLNDKEVSVLEKHLLKLNGVADTQESVMLLSMDENIAGFDVKWANKLRKAIAKRNQKVLDEVYDKFYTQGKELGTSDEMLKYVWDVQIKRQLGYSFSILHTISYSLIALQELNLNYKFNPLYWQVACLTVNSGSNNDEGVENAKNKSTDYGKIAYAIGNITQRGIKVELPDINKAGFGFTPDLENNSIIFGLKGMNGIGDDVVHTIIQHRPYVSFKDFLTRLYDTKLVKKSQTIQLIKGGCFDSFGDRFDIIKQFVLHNFEAKSKLTMANFNNFIELELVPEEFSLNLRLYKYKDYISKFVYEIIKKPKDRLFILDDISTQFFTEHFTDECIVDMVDGQLIISEKKFKKEYDKKMVPVKEWLSQDSTLELLNNTLFEQELIQYLDGNLSKWEMDSLSYYYHEHELAHVNREKYSVSNFFELPEEPIAVKEYEYRGIPRKEYQLFRIAGTVLDKDKDKHTVTILTTDGVVTVKLYSGNFSFYNKQISRPLPNGKKEVVEKSWFTRGNLILATGFRRGNQFVLRKYKSSIFRHTVALIKEISENGDLFLQTERTEA